MCVINYLVSFEELARTTEPGSAEPARASGGLKGRAGPVRARSVPVRRMPPCPREVDSIGIRWRGEVLSGRLSLREASARLREPDQAAEILRRALGK
jgi:hypothetical protein